MKRNSKGQFQKKSRHSRKHRRGMGSIISIRRGMGLLPGGAIGEAIIPALAGGVIAGATFLGVRYFIDPAAGNTQRFVVRHAPWVGHAAGVVAALGLAVLGGKRGMSAAVPAFVAATSVSLALFGSDQLFKRMGGSIALALSDTAATPAAGTAGYRRMGAGAIVPEYSNNGMGAIVMEPVGANGRRAGTIGSYGETVSLNGINAGAFGTPGFKA